MAIDQDMTNKSTEMISRYLLPLLLYICVENSGGYQDRPCAISSSMSLILSSSEFGKFKVEFGIGIWRDAKDFCLFWISCLSIRIQIHIQIQAVPASDFRRIEAV
jgi:hypothetical protein